MSVDPLVVVNSTITQQDGEEKASLSPGLIAAITISVTFIFYLGIMLAVCIGEYCQYARGKKLKVQPGRTRPEAGAKTRSSGKTTHVKTSIDQSETTTAISSSKERTHSYTSAFEKAQACELHSKMTGQADTRIHGDVSDKTEEVKVDHVTVSISTSGCDNGGNGDNVDSVKLDCDIECDNGNDIGMVPLIKRQSEEDFDDDTEIFCDSLDSREMLKMEADV